MQKFIIVLSILAALGGLTGGLSGCSHPFKKESGVSMVVYLQDDRGNFGYDPAATWATRETNIVDDSATHKSHWGHDTLFTIHKYTFDTVKVMDSIYHRPVTKTDTTVLGQWPSKFVQIIKLPH